MKTIAYSDNKSEVLEDSYLAMAKFVEGDAGSKSYYIKRDKNNLLITFESVRGKQDGIKYSKVSKESFDFYMQYLTTRNEVWLRQAQRQVNV